MAQAYDPSYLEGWGKRIISARPVWAMEYVQGQPGKLPKTLSQNKNKAGGITLW